MEDESPVRHARNMTIDDLYTPPAELPDDYEDPPARTVPWYLGDAPMPADEPTDQTGRAAMAAELTQLPLLTSVRHLLDVIGDGLRVTKQGKLFAADRRQVEKLCADGTTVGVWNAYGWSSHVERAWDILTRHGMLLREEGQVRPTGSAVLPEAGNAPSEEGLDGARQLIAAALDTVGIGDTHSWWPGSFSDGELDAVLVASGPDGLTLPVLPSDDRLIHCSETVNFLVAVIRHPHIHDVPIDRATGHLAEQELARLGRVSRTMDHLSSQGLLIVSRRDEQMRYGDYGDYGDYEGGRDRDRVETYRAPVIIRGAIAMLRERRAVQRAEVAAGLL